MLIIVSYKTPLIETAELERLLDKRPDSIGYSVYTNSYSTNDPINRLRRESDLFIVDKQNSGYGYAANKIFEKLSYVPEYILVLNTDVKWKWVEILDALKVMDNNKNLVLAAPIIKDEHGNVQHLSKRDPTVLGLVSRRFVPRILKPGWLQQYDNWYCMREKDYTNMFDVEYLSGCFMLIRGLEYKMIGGFDQGFFLYLEDADITRRLSYYGRCVHMPNMCIVHKWGRGSYKSWRLLFTSIKSSIYYFKKWGIKVW